ncbi:hypothetical protein Tco_1461950, partial [Tanacetum coccineum]
YSLIQEIKFEPNVMCEHVDKKLTFRASQMETSFAFRNLFSLELQNVRILMFPFFLEYVHNRRAYYETLVVRFRSLEKPMEDEFSLEL